MRFFALLLACCTLALAQNTPSPAGKWVSDLKFFAEDNYDHLDLTLAAGKLTGKLGDDAFEGTYQDGRIEGTVKPEPKQTILLHGVLKGDRIEGTATIVEDKIDLKWKRIARSRRLQSRRPLPSSPPSFITSFRAPSRQSCISTRAYGENLERGCGRG